MTGGRQTGRLARLVYAFTAFCAVGSVAVFLVVAAVHYAGPELVPSSTPVPPPRRAPPLDLLLIVGLILAVVVGVASLLLARRITGPLRDLELAASAFGAGDHTARVAHPSDDEIGQAARAFNEMASQTQRLVRGQEQLLADVAHELRTPLARLRIALDLVTEASEAHDPSLLRSMDEDLVELGAIIDGILSSLRLSLGSELEMLEPVQVDVVAQSAVAKLRKDAPHRAVVLELDTGGARVSAQRELLERALYNLLTNALKYSSDAIRVRSTSSREIVEIEIEDSGVGIPSEDLQRVFEPFVRGDRSRQRETGGVGLGLDLVRRIVEAHGGQVSLRSVEGQGTVARVELPRWRAARH